ncbi:MAG: amidohydrolase [Dehalococcoidales bacterium]|nr:amidohydrolase [Dehalococcoidales bacterium]
MIVDFHTHVLPPRARENRRAYVFRDTAFAEIYAPEKSRIATAEDLVAVLDREGISCAVIAGYGFRTHELCVEINDYILDAAARYPGRLFAFCAVSGCCDDSSLAEIERCARAGARGVGELRPDFQLAGATPEKLAPFVGLLRSYDLMLLLHGSEPVGHIYPGKGQATPDRLYRLIGMFGGVAVVLAHWGGGLPFFALMPEVKKRILENNVYFDTAASPLLYRPEIYRQVRDTIGAERILFGSDYPVVMPSRIIKEIEGSGLDDTERTLILSGNARRLLGL